MSANISAPDNGINKPIASSDNKSQRLIAKGLAILCALTGLWLIVENSSKAVSFNLLGDLYQMPLGALLGIVGALFALGSGLFFYSLMLVSTKQTQVSQRKVERLEVTAESSSERVKVLEHKIETLEAALKRALGKS